MAANGDRSREEIQSEIRKQGEVVRNLKQKEQTDDVKAQVCVYLHTNSLPELNYRIQMCTGC